MARETLTSTGIEEQPTPSLEKSFDSTLAFVSDRRVSSFPIDTRAQTSVSLRNMTQEQWEREWEMTGEYLGTDKTLEEIGDEHDYLTREHVRQVVKRQIEHLHQNQSEEVKGEYPLEQFKYSKPRSIHSRRKLSKEKGGKSLKIEQAFLEGKTVPEIKAELHIDNIGQSRKVLSEWGIKVPYEQNPILPRFKELKDPDISDEEKQKLLDSIDSNTLRVLSSGEEPLVISVAKIGREAGLFFRNDKVNIIYELLKSENIPASTFTYEARYLRENSKGLTYYFICVTDKDRAIEAIKSAEELDQYRENPVTVLGKIVDTIPNTYELTNSGNYAHLGSLITEIRGIGPDTNIRIEDIILDDCPVPVFTIRGKERLYNFDQRKHLRKYLKRRLRELGSI